MLPSSRREQAAPSSYQNLRRFPELDGLSELPHPAELRPKAISTYQVVDNSILNRFC
jgi:hypothetical protein